MINEENDNVVFDTTTFTNNITIDQCFDYLNIKNILIFSGPSGIGKSTLAKYLGDKFKKTYEAEVRVYPYLTAEQVRKELDELNSMIYSGLRKLLIVEEVDTMKFSTIEMFKNYTESLKEFSDTGVIQVNLILISNVSKIDGIGAMGTRSHIVEFQYPSQESIIKYVTNHKTIIKLNDNKKNEIISKFNYLFQLRANKVDYRLVNSILSLISAYTHTFEQAVNANNMLETVLTTEELSINNNKVINSINDNEIFKLSAHLKPYKAKVDIYYLANYINKIAFTEAKAYNLLNVKFNKNAGIIALTMKNLLIEITQLFNTQLLDNKDRAQLIRFCLIAHITDLMSKLK